MTVKMGVYVGILHLIIVFSLAADATDAATVDGIDGNSLGR